MSSAVALNKGKSAAGGCAAHDGTRRAVRKLGIMLSQRSVSSAKLIVACSLVVLGLAHAQDAVSAPSPAFDDTPASLDALLPEAALPDDDKPDSYLCTAIKLPFDTLQLTKFEPLATSNAVTSIMLYGERDGSTSHLHAAWCMGCNSLTLI